MTIGIISLFLFSPLSQADMISVKTAHDKGDYAAALKEMRLLSEQGDAEAQNMLGNMYATGKGAPKNLSEALKWYRRAAHQGNPESQYHLGKAYAEGSVTPTVEFMRQRVKFSLQIATTEPERPEDRDFPPELREALKTRQGQYTIEQNSRSDRSFQREWGNVLAYFWLYLSSSRSYQEAIPLRDTVAGEISRENIAEAKNAARVWKPELEYKQPQCVQRNRAWLYTHYVMPLKNFWRKLKG